MAIHPRQPDRAIGYDRIEFGGGRKTAQAPFLLVPAATENPWPRGIFGAETRNLCQRLFERSGVRKVERQGAKPDSHDVEMRIDHPGQHDLSCAINAVIDILWALIAR